MGRRTACVLVWFLLGGICLSHATTARAGENYAFLVAVQEYDKKELRPLKFTRADVLALHAQLLETGFKPENIVLMHDDLKLLAAHYERLGPDFKAKDYLPEAAKIRAEFKLLLGGLRADDSVVVAFAGHGVNFNKDAKSYFCPSDAKLDDPKTLIAFSDLYAELAGKNCKAARKLLLIDACQNDPQTDLSRSRSTVDLDSVTRPQTEPLPEGIIALFSCKAGQKAFEDPALSHGVFFHFVLDGWQGNADLNQDGQISFQELALHAEKKTTDYARLKLKVLQTPQLRSEFSGEWVLKKLGDNKPVTNSIGMKLVRIPAGTFQMGSPMSESGRNENEGPQHAVRVSRTFLMGTHEVTQEEYESVTGANPSWFADQGGGRTKVPGVDTSRFPVEMVSWYDVLEFCNKLSANEERTPRYRLTKVVRAGNSMKSAEVELLAGTGYRLPTEAEWEYACRAGTTTPFHFGSELNGDQANVDGNHPFGTTTKGIFQERPQPVGSYAKNAFGLYDMHGNVWEWCFDNLDVRPSTGEVTVDPVTTVGEHKSRVLRGGSWDDVAKDARSAIRGSSTPANHLKGVGFRVARSL